MPLGGRGPGAFTDLRVALRRGAVPFAPVRGGSCRTAPVGGGGCLLLGAPPPDRESGLVHTRLPDLRLRPGSARRRLFRPWLARGVVHHEGRSYLPRPWPLWVDRGSRRRWGRTTSEAQVGPSSSLSGRGCTPAEAQVVPVSCPGAVPRARRWLFRPRVHLETRRDRKTESPPGYFASYELKMSRVIPGGLGLAHAPCDSWGARSRVIPGGLGLAHQDVLIGI